MFAKVFWMTWWLVGLFIGINAFALGEVEVGILMMLTMVVPGITAMMVIQHREGGHPYRQDTGGGFLAEQIGKQYRADEAWREEQRQYREYQEFLAWKEWKDNAERQR